MINRIDFDNDSIDFLMTYRNFGKKYGFKTVSRRRFVVPIVEMAKHAIAMNVKQEDIKGIKECLKYLIRRISWKEYIWFIPVGNNTLFTWGYNEEDAQVISLLSDSLILTIIAYAVELHGMGNADKGAVFADIVLGFEQVCDWITRGVSIKPDENDLIEILDIEHLKTFIIE